MKTPRLILSLSLSLLTGLTVAACDGDAEYEGRSCEMFGSSLTCDSADKVSYCGYMESAHVGELTQGPCIPVDEIECEPDTTKHEGPTADQGEPGEGDPCAGTDYRCEVLGGEPQWVEQFCATPLVLRFDQRPVEMIAHEATPMATFDINMAGDSCITTDWPTAATPWLVVDLDGNGSIDGGHELFGSGSRLADGRPAAHGFAALAEFDSNADGSVDASDARFGELMLWRDSNADRLSTPDELAPLTGSGVERLAVDYWVRTECDDRGNCGVQRAAFEFGGGVGEIVDIYLNCR